MNDFDKGLQENDFDKGLLFYVMEMFQHSG